MDMIEIPLHLIDEDTDQPRYQFDEASLQELMESVKELGLLSPIKVRTVAGGRYKIIYGNRRYKACRELGLPAIPCIVSTVTDEMEIYLEQIAENLTREGFSPIEEAEAFYKLMNDSKFSSSTKFLSSKLGKPESYIKNKCELLKFSNAVKKLIVGGTEIRKDRLTEDQLLPLKDLPMEHRDALALIAARDELPVSDVKKIAKLFKDKDMSSSTKDKLLYKSGRELLETYSVREANKAERAKSAEPKPAAVNGGAAKTQAGARAEQTGAAQAREDLAQAGASAAHVDACGELAARAGAVQAYAGASEAPAGAGGELAARAGAELEALAIADAGLAAKAGAGSERAAASPGGTKFEQAQAANGLAERSGAAPEAANGNVGAGSGTTAAQIEDKLQQLLAALSSPESASPEVVDSVIDRLEHHLALWKMARPSVTR